MRKVSRYLEDLKRAHGTLPPRSTAFFAGVPAFAGWQAGDGPLIRWAYQDSSLRSYHFRMFSLEKARRGPMFIFKVAGDSLHEHTDRSLVPFAVGLMLDESLDTALDDLVCSIERDSTERAAHYCLAWVQWARGDTADALPHLRRLWAGVKGGPTPEVLEARRLLAVADTAGATRLLEVVVLHNALDPEPHALLADIELRREAKWPDAALHSFITRVLEPDNPV
jgi:hypothetical protein